MGVFDPAVFDPNVFDTGAPVESTVAALRASVGGADLSLVWDQVAADLALDAAQGDLGVDDGLETAVLVSLFTDRRADDGDALPDGHTDRRGWWGDAFPVVPEDRIGSRLWLLSREKEQLSVVARAREYALEALQWLITDRIALAVDVVAEITRPGMLGLQITIQKPTTDVLAFQYRYTWAAQEARR